jgi:hypothetical protein
VNGVDAEVEGADVVDVATVGDGDVAIAGRVELVAGLQVRRIDPGLGGGVPERVVSGGSDGLGAEGVPTVTPSKSVSSSVT